MISVVTSLFEIRDRSATVIYPSTEMRFTCIVLQTRLNGIDAAVALTNCEQVMKVLNVAEKNDAAKSIAGYLSRGTSRRREGLSVYNKIYEFDAQLWGKQCKMIMTSVAGHLLNYDFVGQYRNWQKCSPLSLFDAPIVKNCEENYMKIKKTLEREINFCQALIIWTDCDREGENIGFEIIQVCQAVKPNIKIYRAKFSEITQPSVTRALHNLEEPKKAVSDAVDVRSQLDLRIGAAFTRFQTLRFQQVFPQKLADMIISYGSCQFPTLGFVVERFLAIERFVPEPFWRIRVTDVRDDLSVEFKWERNRLFESLPCQVLLDICLESPDATVEKVSSKPKTKWRPLPLDTVELSKLGSRKLRLNAKETMKIAEKLYTQGYISYPRTETNIFPKELNLIPLIEQQTASPQWGPFAQRVLEQGPNPRCGKKNDQAHPPIHPTKYTDSMGGNEGRLYEFITRHFLACLSRDAEGEETVVTIDIANEKFIATGLRIIARNYLDVYPYENWNAKEIHAYEQGQVFRPTKIDMVDGETSPPNLLTEADLIALMDKHGIGTDATHAEHIEKIKSRHYVGLRDERHFVPGKLGIGLVMGYDSMGFEMSKPNLRAELENDLKLICDGIKNPADVLQHQISKYRTIFVEAMQKVNLIDDALARYLEERPMSIQHIDVPDPEPIVSVFKCVKCGTDMILRDRRNGSGKYIGCMGYPTCNNAIWFPQTVEDVQVLPETCNQCPGNMRLLNFKFRPHAFPTLGTTHRACIGGCDDNINEALNIQSQSVRNVRSQELISQNQTSNHTSNLNSRTNNRLPNTTRENNGRTDNERSNDSRRYNVPERDSGVSSWSITSAWVPSSNSSNATSNQTHPPSTDDDVYVCNCRDRAVQFTVRKEGPNQGRLFYKCAKPQGQGCDFFLWGADEPSTGHSVQTNQTQSWNRNTNYSTNKPDTSQTGNVRRRNLSDVPADDGELICTCGNPARKLTVNKDGPNKGRQFYGCPQGMGSPCNFFKWADETNVPQNVAGTSGQGRGGQSNRAGSSRQPTKRKCGNCGQEGHTRRTCPETNDT